MLRSSLSRRSAACATLLAIGVTTLVGGGNAAYATHGPSGVLTSSNGSFTIATTSGAPIVSEDGYTVTDAAWSPDGSRAVFINNRGDVATIGKSPLFPASIVYPIDQNFDELERATPEWVGDGSTVIWAEKSAGGLWRIQEALAGQDWGAAQRSPNDGKHYLEPDTNADQRIVVQRQSDDGSGVPTGTPEIGFLDGNTFTLIATDAASPTISATGQKVAFIRGGQVWTASTAGRSEVQVTSGGSVKSDPVLNADGTQVAFAQGSAIATAPTTAGATPTVVSGLSGVPDYRPVKKDRVVRLAGSERFTTATAISQSHWATGSNASDPRAEASAAVLSRSDNFADALGGSALAAAKNGPLLMTRPAGLHPATAAELTRVLKPGDTVYLLGGTGALSTAVENQVKALGFATSRLSGADRYATSISIANAIDPTPDMVLAATGANFPDALAAGAAAGAQNLPGKGLSAVVVLTKGGGLTAATKAYLDALPDTTGIFSVGGAADLATQAYLPAPLVGADRYETAALVAWIFFGGFNHLGVATGGNWPDALAGGALMASLDAPLVLAPGNGAQVGDYLWAVGDEHAGSIHTGIMFGGSAVLNDIQRDGLGLTISGPAGFTTAGNPTDVLRAATGVQDATAKRAATAEATGAPRTVADFKAAAEAAAERFAEKRR
ncbi:cell wall-binding repeat-containing protein [Micromonospora phytophila]|uniref:cell wall-binding repeat-containing protein n=1 Tax=Micromonospora phytophila TaxID=709888 RepID=UPI00202E9721|nr:cell wall-binding repeat-containing protein [Micromonospora phytophila]MCM0674108.1 cell wall-binding repeat-containing protein [Micromonospora phytophila]